MRNTLAVMAVAASLFALPATPAFASGAVGCLTGTVIDANTKAPIAAVTVDAVSPGGSYRAITDARGSFWFSHIAVDTYTLTFSAPHYDRFSVQGVALIANRTVGMESIPLRRSTLLIGGEKHRSAGDAFPQPNQTLDAYVIQGQRIQQTTGRNFWTGEKDALLLAVPGITLTDAGMITIRGGAPSDVGYQYDGVSLR